MRNVARSPLLVGLAFMVLEVSCLPAPAPGDATSHNPATQAITRDCSKWSLDGYQIGMKRSTIDAVRAATSYLEGQLQVIAPGKLRGVVVLDADGELEKWDVTYGATSGDTLRAELRRRFGDPMSDDSRDSGNEEQNPVRVHKTTWRSTACDTGIMVIERTRAAQDADAPMVRGLLIRAAALEKRIEQEKRVLD